MKYIVEKDDNDNRPAIIVGEITKNIDPDSFANFVVDRLQTKHGICWKKDLKK